MAVFGLFCLIWALGLLVAEPASAFLFRTSSPVITTRFATLSPTPSSSSQVLPTDEEAEDLLEVLLQRFRTNQATDYDIGRAIDRLSDARVCYDPAECFNGPLYAVLHQQGPKKPLWETIGLANKRNNIKGQRYIYKPETQDYDIANYAEILGKGEKKLSTVVGFVESMELKFQHWNSIQLAGLFIQVEGTAKAMDTTKEAVVESETTDNTQSRFLDGVINLFGTKSAQKTSNLPQCPCDVLATVTGGDLYAGGNKVLPLNFIQGKGVTRVLYANPKLRILATPYQSNGGWEDKGLITIQVREDLLQ